MSIFNTNNNAKPYTVSQPQLNSSDRTAQLKAKTKYAAAVNLAKNGGVLTKQDGSKYIGTVHTNSVALTSTASYADLLDVTKGKYLLTPPPSSNLATSFAPENGEVYYGSFTVTNYDAASIPVTMLGFPTINNLPLHHHEYEYPNQLVVSGTPSGTTTTPASTTVTAFNESNIVVDPEYKLFYGTTTCGQRDYFKNVYIDPSIDVKWKTEEGRTTISSRAYNQQQAQRILANQAQSLRGFQFPTRVHFDLENCGSKPSITPVAPDAPVIYISSQTETSPGSGFYVVTISWLHGFDGGSPITSGNNPDEIHGYTIYYTSSDITPTHKSISPKPCLNSFTVTVLCGTEIYVTASNCVPITQYQSSPCITLTSGPSNSVWALPCPTKWMDIESTPIPSATAWIIDSNGHYWVGVNSQINVYADDNLSILLKTIILASGTTVYCFCELYLQPPVTTKYMMVGGVVGSGSSVVSLFIRIDITNFSVTTMQAADGTVGVNGPIFTMTVLVDTIVPTSNGHPAVYCGGSFDKFVDSLRAPVVPVQTVANLFVVSNCDGSAVNGDNQPLHQTYNGTALETNGAVYSSAVYLQNDVTLYIGGDFTTVGHPPNSYAYCASYSQEIYTFYPVASVNSPVYNLACSVTSTQTDGYIIATGAFTTPHKYGCYIQVTSADSTYPPTIGVTSLGIGELSPVTNRGCLSGQKNILITTPTPTQDILTMDNLDVYVSSTLSTWEYRFPSYTSATPTGIMLTTANPGIPIAIYSNHGPRKYIT